MEFPASKNKLVYGTGQCSENSPHIWTILSSVLLTMFNEDVTGARYTSQGTATVHVSSTAYVDNMNTHHNVGNTDQDLFDDMLQDYNR
jgi:hypothetical protein